MDLGTQQKIYFTLRIASAMCFIGHGAFGIITKPIWENYFGVFGIGHHLSLQLMPVVGIIDIVFGIALLLYPVKAVFIWLVMWGLMTALLRPLSGEPFAEFVERAGNFGAPLALLLFASGIFKPAKNLFIPFRNTIKPTTNSLENSTACLQVVVFLLFAGHGWLNLMEKKSLIDQYRGFGFVNPGNAAQAIGIFEIIMASAVLIRPYRALILIIFFWKIVSELFYPHYGFFEWVERGGSYGAVLALWFALELIPVKRRNMHYLAGIFLQNNSNKIGFNQSMNEQNRGGGK